MADRARERILEATYACIARYGMAKTTVEDAARQARVSRATVYRHFPGGKDELLAETVGWETARFFGRLAVAVAGTPDFPTLLEEALLFAHRAIAEHEVLQKVLQTEPERLLPLLTVESDHILAFIQAFLVPLLEAQELAEGVSVARAAEHLARMILSYTATQGRWDLTDRAQVADIVRRELLAGVLAAPGAGAPSASGSE
jgi:AcrR family transcriptional regulator